jgi:beta-mannosidase
MHISHRVDVTSFLKANDDNVLELKFQNAPECAKKEMKRIGYKGNRTDVHFGGPERLFVRKAQYHWGWDWGPAVNTSGPWKEVWVEVFEERIMEFIVRQEVSRDLRHAVVKVSGIVEGERKVDVSVIVPDGKTVVLKEELDVGENGIFAADLTIEKPEPWWPFTYGPLYTIKATLAGGADEQVRKLGIRRLKLL